MGVNLQSRAMLGCRFGRRVVTGFAGKRHRALYWHVRCECGTKGVVAGTVLRHGLSQQCLRCGHVANQNARRLPKEDARFRQCYWAAKSGAKTRGYAWRLTQLEYRNLALSPCTYCGEINPSGFNGVDRIDNTLKEYKKDAVVPCCWNCNRAKGELSVKDFELHIAKMYQHLLEKQRGL